MGRATAGLDGGKIVLKFPYSQEAVRAAKTVPGAAWDKAGRRWTYPLSMATCRSLRRAYGDDLAISQELRSWAVLQTTKEAKQISTGKALDAKLEIVPRDFPELAAAMEARPYQKTGTRFVADGRCVALLDEVGLGKTLISIAGTIEAGNWAGDHLVIAKKTALESVWGNQLAEWTGGKAEVFICEGAQAKRKAAIQRYLASAAESKWLIINAQMLGTKKDYWCPKCKEWSDKIPKENLDHFTLAHPRVGKISLQTYPELQSVAWRAIIADEAHEFLSTGVKSSQNMTQVATGLTSLKTTKDCVRLALTGTPDRGRELNLYGLLFWLHPKVYSSKWAWIDHYFTKIQTNYGTEVGGIRKDAEKDFWRMLDVHALRRTKAEVRPDLAASFPPVVEWVPLEGKHRKQYEQMVTEGRLDIKGQELDTGSFLAEFIRQQQLAWGVWKFDAKGNFVPTAESPKLERLLDMLAERGVNPHGRGDFKVSERHFKYIIASRFTQIVDFLDDHFRKDLGIPTLKITGGVSSSKRTAAVKSFQEDPAGPRILLLNTLAGGASITLDRHCEDMFILDQTYKVDDQKQLHGRIDNRSVTAAESVPRSFIYLHTKGTIERRMAEGNADQMEMQNRLYDARRGVELQQMILGEE